MRIPCSNTVPIEKKNFYKRQPTTFAVMANPEILRLSGKTAKDPMDRDALVDLMLDFVEAMNPEVKFKREFSVLKDRDLTGELKDIWLAIQVKREREKEKTENGKKSETGDREKRKEGRDEDSDKQRKVKIIDQDKEKGKCTEAFPTWFAMEQEQTVEKGNREGTEFVELKTSALLSNNIHTKRDQESKKKCVSSCEGNEEEVIICSFKTDVRKLGDIAVRHINSMCDACEVPVTQSGDSRSSPTHKQKNKMRSCKSELFTQTVQHSDEINNGKAEGSGSDIPCVNEIGIITKHTVFKEICPSSSDSSEDEERGEFRLNSLNKVIDNETDSKQIVGLLQDVGMSDVSQSLDNIDIDIYTNDSAVNANELSSGLEPCSSQKAVCVEDACTYGSTDLKSSYVKHCKFLCMKYSAIKNSTNKHQSGKQNVHVASKFKGPESCESCLAHAGRFKVLVPKD
ncbi:uncharacterized protein LOC111861278 isoform X2 [Cryptotermes secundus]|nr:uncharacterized protein LOC111861278 isoform X2 [Cryptotermes secundus]